MKLEQVAIQQALEALEDTEGLDPLSWNFEKVQEAITALREALAEQADQEPVAWGRVFDGDIIDCICPEEHALNEGDYTLPLYAAPVRTKDLTEQQALEKLCNYINQNFKTQKEAAKSFEVAEGFLSMVLNGKKPITKEMAHRLSLTRQTMFLELTSPASGKAAPVQQVDQMDLDETIMVGMANYIDKLGGDSQGFRAIIAKYKEKNK